MNEIYPTQRSRMALEVFQLYEGEGEFFDLSQLPPVRESFTFGGAEAKKAGYEITIQCISCGVCMSNCPVSCIKEGSPYKIEQKNCIHCGNCHEVCPVQAVVKL